MLRKVLLAVAAGMLAAGLVLLARHVPAPGWQLLSSGAVLLLALVFERWRYRSADSSGSRGWRRTGERFEDPETGQVMEVLFDPSSGQRRYVKAMPAQPEPDAGTTGTKEIP